MCLKDCAFVDGCYTLSEVAHRTGAKTRALQAWTDGGVLESTSDTDRAGRGVHRLYQVWEVRIAALLVPLAKMGVPIGHLKSFAALLRPMVLNAKAILPAVLGVSDDQHEITKALARAIDGEGENFLCFAWGEGFQWVSVKMDGPGPACICPSRDFHVALKTTKNANAFVVIDLTSLLHAVAD